MPHTDHEPPTAAAWSTMRTDRRFLWFWLGTATSLSVAGNVGHAWLTVVAGSTRSMAIGWAVAPPILLMLAIHGLPTLTRMLGTDERDKLLTAVVWGVTVGAFGWSAFGIFGFTTAMGVPAQMGWVAPFVIDLSVFGATRGLVLTAPLAARMKAGIASNQRVTAQVPAAAEPSLPQVARPKPASAAAAPADLSTPARPRVPVIASETRELAEQIVAAGAVRKPIETVAAILATAAGESRKAVIAEAAGVHHSVVTKTLEAAESHRRHQLAAVG